jgi:hypothetical protein
MLNFLRKIFGHIAIMQSLKKDHTTIQANLVAVLHGF